MRRLCRSFALLAALTAAMQWAGTSVQAQVIPYGEAAGNWDYLYTINPDSGNAVNPEADLSFQAGGFAIWASSAWSNAVSGVEVDTGTPVSLTWQSGPAPFDYGTVTGIQTYLTDNGETGTALTQPTSGQRYTHYFRKEFTTSSDVTNFLLNGIIDDGAIIFIDGFEVGQFSQPLDTTQPFTTIPPYVEQTNGNPNENNYLTEVLDLRFFDNETLPAGNHVLGVQIHQDQTGSSDLGLLLELVAQEGENELAADASGSWTSGGNWTFGQAPNAAGDVANMNNDAASPLYFNGVFTIGALNIDNATGYTIIGLGTMTVDNADGGNASINVAAGSTDVQIETSLNSATDLSVGGGASITFNNDVLTNGNTLTKTGAGTATFNNYVDGDIVMAAGAATGSGTVGGNLTNESGVVSPGDGVGPMQVEGNYSQGAAGELAIEIAGNDDYDVLNVGGLLDADGQLSVSLVGNYDPALGATFNILNFGDVSGAFSSLDLPALDGGKVWDASSLYATGSLSVVPEPSTFLLGGLSALLFGLVRRRR